MPVLVVLRNVATLFLILGLLGGARKALAASCCSSGGSQLGWLSSENRAQFTIRNSYVSVIGEVGSGTRPLFYRPSHTEQEWILGIEGSRLLTDRVQMTGRIPIHFRSAVSDLGSASHFGLMDPTFGLAYEVLPAWSYHPWLPTGWATLTWSIPWARSPWESTQQFLVDATGRGQHWIGLGTLLTRTFQKWTVTAQAMGRFGIPNTVSGPGGPEPLGWGLGFEGLIRLGFEVSPTASVGIGWAPSLETSRPRSAESRTKVSFPIVFQVIVDLADGWNLTGAYSDPTLLPGASNIQFERVFSIILTRFWAR